MIAPMNFRLRNVLFASDFSPYSDHAFEAALALAQHFGARLHLLHVVHHPHEREAAHAALGRFAMERATLVDFVVDVAIGTPASEIVAHAAREKMDLIVVGSHGRTGLPHVWHGSVAEAVRRHAHCLVLTIRKSGELPLEAAESRAQAPHLPAPGAAHRDRCLVCALPSGETICATCRNHIQAEAFNRWRQWEPA
jgi:nucleotide-binding universal stress UspA family protein